MEQLLLAFAIFLVLGGIILGIFYLVMNPTKDKAIRQRLQSFQYSTQDVSAGDQSALLRQKALSQLPALDRFFNRIPIPFLQLGQQNAVGHFAAFSSRRYRLECLINQFRF